MHPWLSFTLALMHAAGHCKVLNSPAEIPFLDLHLRLSLALAIMHAADV